MRNGPTAAAKDFDIVRAVFAQTLDNLGEELDMPTVVTGDANGAYIFLDRRADNVADRAMVPEINHFNAVPDEFQIDRVDGAVVPVANRDSGQDSNRGRHLRTKI